MSRLHHGKGLDYVADAFAGFSNLVDNVDLVVAGPDHGEQALFEAKIKQLNLQKRVHMVGPLYGERKYAALRDAMCFLLPSRQEGFSMAITEAMAFGLPVVISESCHFPEVADSGAGIVTPLDTEAIQEALVDMATDENSRKQMGQIGKTLVFNKYTWDAIASNIVAEYERMINSSPTLH